jgi:hypothetical protein
MWHSPKVEAAYTAKVHRITWSIQYTIKVPTSARKPEAHDTGQVHTKKGRSEEVPYKPANCAFLQYLNNNHDSDTFRRA